METEGFPSSQPGAPLHSSPATANSTSIVSLSGGEMKEERREPKKEGHPKELLLIPGGEKYMGEGGASQALGLGAKGP